MRQKHMRTAAVISLILGFVIALVGEAAETNTGVSPSLAIAYHVAPKDRGTFRHELETATYTQFSDWKKNGLVSRFQLFFNRYADSPNWDAMLLVSFPTAAEFERWNKLPTGEGGLDKAALDLVTSIESVPVTFVRSAGKPRQYHPRSVFLVIPYEVLVSTDEYLRYLDGYTIPQFSGWIDEGVLSGFSIAMARYPAGRPWSSLILLEYASDDALNRREVVVSKIRAKLKEDATWKAISDDKKSVRSEKEVIVANEIIR